MLDPNLLRNESDAVTEGLTSRGFKLGVGKLRAFGERHKVLQIQTENLQAEHNSRSKSIGQAKTRGEGIESLRLEVNKLNEGLDVTEAEFDTLQAGIRDIVLTIPSLPADDVPVGKDENDNVEVSRWGTPREFDSKMHDYVTLGGVHTGLDFATAVRLTDSRSVVVKRRTVRMHRVLSQFVLDLHIEQHSYNEDYVPYLVNHNTLYGIRRLPEFTDDLLHTHPLDREADNSNYALISTAEVPLTDLTRDKIVDEDALPTKMTARTLRFRSEAGFCDHNARGLICMHQSDKVEMVRIIRPEGFIDTLEEMTGHAEKILQLPGLPHRKIILYTGDMGFDACKTYDLEVRIPAQNTYRKISSCSNVWDFQVRHVQARCRSKSDKRTHLVHTLNGSGLAVERTLVVVMENYQRVDGHIQVSEVLRPHMNGLEFIG